MSHLRLLATALFTALAATALATAPAVAVPKVPTQVTASVDVTEVDAGQEVTVTGRVTKETAGGPVGVANGGVTIRACADPTCSQSWGGTTATTDPDGYFVKRFAPPRTAHLGVYFIPSWPAQGDLVGSSTLTSQVGVLQLTDHSIIGVTREADGRVKFHGLIGFPSRVMPPTHPVIRVEFAADGATWTTVDTVTSRPFHNGYLVYTSYVAEANPGYWRGVFDGQPAAAKASTTGTAYVG